MLKTACIALYQPLKDTNHVLAFLSLFLPFLSISVLHLFIISCIVWICKVFWVIMRSDTSNVSPAPATPAFCTCYLHLLSSRTRHESRQSWRSPESYSSGAQREFIIYPEKDTSFTRFLPYKVTTESSNIAKRFYHIIQKNPQFY